MHRLVKNTGPDLLSTDICTHLPVLWTQCLLGSGGFVTGYVWTGTTTAGGVRADGEKNRSVLQSASLHVGSVGGSIAFIFHALDSGSPPQHSTLPSICFRLGGWAHGVQVRCWPAHPFPLFACEL